MKHVDCLFIHPTTHVGNPRQRGRGQELAYLVLPVGTIALANLLDKEGYGARIIHTGVEESFNRNFSIEGLLKEYDASVVGVDLHWYVHSYDALRIAHLVKQSSNSLVVLGGFTASFFAEEILTRFKTVDAVIRGDAEIPLLSLVRQRSKHDSSEGFGETPNLIYREGRSVKRSRRRYTAGESILNQLDFSNFDLLEDFDKYVRLSLSVKLGYSNLNRIGYPCLGRGCTMNCSYCGGGKEAYKNLTGLESPIYLSKDRVVEQLARLVERKISTVYLGFDPKPGERGYFQELFSMIRREKIDVGSQFEMWGLSDREFLKDFRRTFNTLYSSLVHSTQTGSEEVRRLNIGYHYSNRDLFHWLDKAKEELVPVELAFASGLSWETEERFQETIQVAEKIVDRYPMVLDMYCVPINLEPCSPRFLHPDRYGVTLKFRQFIDYYLFFKGVSEGSQTPSVLGYETEQLSESQIIGLSNSFYTALQKHISRDRQPVTPR